MELTKDNFLQWENQLNIISEKNNLRNGKKPYSTVLSRHEWESGFLNQTPEEVVEDDLYYLSQN